MTRRSLSPLATEVLAGIHQHGLLSTRQIHALYVPNGSMRAAQQIMWHRRPDDSTGGLAGVHPALVQSIGTPERSPTKLWFLTRAGLDAMPRAEHRVRPIAPQAAAGPMQAHTLRVNDVGVAFVMAARARGDECGPLAWRREVEHHIGPGRGRGAKAGEIIRPDALLRYTLFRDDGTVVPLSRFIELDRHTMQTEDLQAKLRRYARLWSYTPPGAERPAWKELYPYGFPEVLVVLTGRHRRALERRRDILLAFAEQDPQIRGAPGLVISCTLLEDLVREERIGGNGPLRYVLPPSGGPFETVFVRHDRRRTYVDWLGRQNSRTTTASVQAAKGTLL